MKKRNRVLKTTVRSPRRVAGPKRASARARVVSRRSAIESSRHELAQRNAELAIINSIQQALASKLEMQAIYELVGDKIREIFDAQVVVITTFDLSAHEIHTNYLFENGKRFFPEPYPPSPFAARLLESRQSLLVRTRKEFEKLGSRTTPGTATAQSGIFVPLLVGGELRGGISLQNIDHENAFSGSDVRLLETLASSMSVALENARLFDETQHLLKETEQRSAELQIINSVQQALASRLELQAIYELIGDKIHEIFFDAQVVDILTYDRTTDLLHPRYVIERDKRFEVKPWSLVGFRKYVVATRQPLVINRDLERLAVEFGNSVIVGEMVKSAVYVPMIVGDQVTVIISLQHIDRENAFSESDVRLLQTLANSMSVALENARLFNELQTRNREITEALEQQTATSEILRVIASSPTDIQPVLEAIVKNAARLCDSYDSTVWQVDGDLMRGGAHWGPVPFIDAVPLNRDSVTARSILDRETIHVHDVLAEPEFPLSQVYHETSGQRTMLAIPLLREGVAIGALLVRRVEVKPFSDKQVELLKTFADQAAIAIENVRLFNETKRLLNETQQRAAELAIINSVQQGLAAQLDVQAIYNLVGDKIREIFDAQSILIATFDHEKTLKNITYGYEKGERFYPPPRSLGDSPLSQYLIRTRKPILINQNMEEQSKAIGMRFIAGEPPQSAVFVPFIVRDAVMGYVSLENIDRENAFSDSDVRLLTTLANSMSVALENAQLRDKERIYLKGLERELEIGRQIQFSFLPDELPQPLGWEIAARFLPARQVSGDLYDVFALQGDGTVGLVIADVCDKGVGAALYMALFRSLIRATSNLEYYAGQTSPASGQPAQFSHNVSLKNAVMLTNNYIARTHEQANMFATVFFGVLDPATGVLSYINGGHEPPIIFGAGGVKTTLVRTGMAVGLMPDIPFGIAETHLEPGDTLLAFTDGVVDAQNLADESFGREKLISLLTSPAPSATALIDRIETSLREHIADTNQFDDITMLAVRRRAS